MLKIELIMKSKKGQFVYACPQIPFYFLFTFVNNTIVTFVKQLFLHAQFYPISRPF